MISERPTLDAYIDVDCLRICAHPRSFSPGVPCPLNMLFWEPFTRSRRVDAPLFVPLPCRVRYTLIDSERIYSTVRATLRHSVILARRRFSCILRPALPSLGARLCAVHEPCGYRTRSAAQAPVASCRSRLSLVVARASPILYNHVLDLGPADTHQKQTFGRCPSAAILSLRFLHYTQCLRK